MQKKKFIITLLFAVLSIFMITACSDSSNESNSGVNNGGGGTVQPEPEPKPDNLTVKKLYNFNLDKSYLSTYALLSDGSLYAWGDNNYGQLGLGDNASIYYPSSNNQKINIPDKINEVIGLKDIKYDASERTTFYKYSLYAITENGELYAWGDNSDGQLGIGNTDNQTKPVKITGITGKIKQIITFKHYGVAFFDYFSVYAITEDGSLYAWGNNSNGPLGLGNTDNQTKPVKVTAITDKIKELIVPESSSSDSIIIAITEDNSLYTWGDNGYGKLGIGSNEHEVYIPTKVNLPGKIKELRNNKYSVYAILENDSLYAWGDNYVGQLGVGDELQKNTPTKVNLPGKIKELIEYSSSIYTILEDGSLYAWGSNSSGELGVGDEVNRNTPTKVNLPGKIKELIINRSSAYAVLENGSLYAWGSNYNGQLGVGDEVYKNTPTKVNLPGTIKELIAGDSVYALTEDGSLYEWGGYNFSGQLGVGSENEYVNTPTKVNLPGTIKELIIGAFSFYAILEDSTLYAWGFNFSGQLGIGSENEYEYEYVNTPNKVNLPGTIKELITYGNSVYAILEDNSLYAWGYNKNGELGVGKYDEIIYTPEQVTGIDGVIKYINLVYKSSNSDAVVHFLTEDGLLYGTGLNYSSSPKKIEFKEK